MYYDNSISSVKSLFVSNVVIPASIYIIKRAVIATLVWWAALFFSIVFSSLIFHFAIAPPPAVHIETPIHFSVPPKSNFGGNLISPPIMPGPAASATEKLIAALQQLYHPPRPPQQHYGPFARGCLAPFAEGQAYDYSLSMTVPETPTNFNAGVFMVRLILFDSELSMLNVTRSTQRLALDSVDEILDLDGVTAVAERPLMLRWKSPLLRTIYTYLFAIPLSMGISWFQEVQTLETTILSSEVFLAPESSTTTTTDDRPFTYQNPPRSREYDTASSSSARKSAQQCYAILLNSPTVQVYSAQLTVDADIGGLRYYCYHYSYTCWSVGSVITFSVTAGIAALVMLFSILRDVTLHFISSPKSSQEYQSEAERQASMRIGAHRNAPEPIGGGNVPAPPQLSNRPRRVNTLPFGMPGDNRPTGEASSIPPRSPMSDASSAAAQQPPTRRDKGKTKVSTDAPPSSDESIARTVMANEPAEAEEPLEATVLRRRNVSAQESSTQRQQAPSSTTVEIQAGLHEEIGADSDDETAAEDDEEELQLATATSSNPTSTTKSGSNNTPQ